VIGAGDYLVALGQNRLAMLDSGPDIGIVNDLGDVTAVVAGTADEDMRLFADTNPNQRGIEDRHLTLVRQALQEAAPPAA